MSAPEGAEDRDGLSVTHLDAQQVRLINDNGKARPAQNSVNPPLICIAVQGGGTEQLRTVEFLECMSE